MTLQGLVDRFRRLSVRHWFPAKVPQKLSCAGSSPSGDYLAVFDFTLLEPVDISGIDEPADYEFAINEVPIV
jgi:hypothetical protein